MKKSIQTYLQSFGVMSLLVLGVASAVVVPAAGVFGEVALAAPSDTVQKGINAAGGGSGPKLESLFKTIVNVLLFIIGAVSVIMIIVGGFRYVTSGGDQAHVKAAKDTILYAVVGLIVALLAFAIVGFVAQNIK